MRLPPPRIKVGDRVVIAYTTDDVAQYQGKEAIVIFTSVKMYKNLDGSHEFIRWCKLSKHNIPSGWPESCLDPVRVTASEFMDSLKKLASEVIT